MTTRLGPTPYTVHLPTSGTFPRVGKIRLGTATRARVERFGARSRVGTETMTRIAAVVLVAGAAGVAWFAAAERRAHEQIKRWGYQK